MGMLVRAAVLLSPLLFCNAFLNLTGPSELEGVWKGSTILPCAYVPVKDLVQQTLTWTVVHDQSSGTIFRRDDSGDHVLLSEYRGRVSVLKDAPGNVSLHILNLEISDRGTYTCQVTWKASNNTLIAKEITTKVDVVKVAATKPVIRASEPGLTFAPGARTSLTCVASGSPPISYRWFRSGPGGEARLLSSQAELAWDSLQPSDTGTYFCEAENRVGARAVQQSDAVELTVSGESPAYSRTRLRQRAPSFTAPSDLYNTKYKPCLDCHATRKPRGLASFLLQSTSDRSRGQGNIPRAPPGPGPCRMGARLWPCLALTGLVLRRGGGSSLRPRLSHRAPGHTAAQPRGRQAPAHPPRRCAPASAHSSSL
ncbi:V-set and immunoglobulin domain-containing protein 4-like isoform X4 [Phalacrocorax carbo]|uniref:V-set and immunoglobulin domain-containing protein 4-like isoform X4 n=1 Tax=Phalacrocorax carbo TaxID=9209 RepID=UPI0031192E22